MQDGHETEESLIASDEIEPNDAEHREMKRAGGGWATPASLILHAVFAFALFFHLPPTVAEPDREETVKVEIVPPPEEEKQEEAKKEEPAKPEEAKAEPPPPPPPPPKQEEAKSEPPAGKQARPQPEAMLRPVFQFAEKDSGSRQANDGNAAQEAAKPPTQAEAGTAPTQPPMRPAEQPTLAETPATGTPLPDDVKAPEVDLAGVTSQSNAPAAEPAPDATRLDIVTTPNIAKPQPDPSKKPPTENPTEMVEAKTLFSQQLSADPVAAISMAGIPRDVRGGELCSTELRAQLLNASYRVGFFPRPRLGADNVIDVQRAGVQLNGEWYDISFNCELDGKATKVISFAFKVGAAIPRNQWRTRGFPSP